MLHHGYHACENFLLGFLLFLVFFPLKSKSQQIALNNNILLDLNSLLKNEINWDTEFEVKTCV